MNMTCRKGACRSLLLAIAAAAIATVCAGAAAQSFPNKDRRSPAGSGLDYLTRVVAEPMSKDLGQPILVENRPGANGSIAAIAVAGSAPDGHTLLCADVGTYAMNQHLFSKLAYDPRRDFRMVGMMVTFPS